MRWMEKEFTFDAERFERYKGTLPPPRTPEETFGFRSGIYFDAAVFAKETLNRINPSYQAKVAVVIIRPYGANHYFCAFQDAGKSSSWTTGPLIRKLPEPMVPINLWQR